MRYLSWFGLLVLTQGLAPAHAGIGGSGTGGRPSFQDPVGDGAATSQADPKPEAAAKKAYAAGAKSLDKARAYLLQAQQAPSAERKAAAIEKANDAYYKALDQFTEALSNKGDLADAWLGAGYVHLRIGAYGEALDDYNHALKLRPDSTEGIEARAEAALNLRRLDDVQSAYMDLFNHDRPRADQLMKVMQQWTSEREVDPQGLRPERLAGFSAWIAERVRLAQP